MLNKQFNRRQIIRYMATLSILSALPSAAIAKIITRQPPNSSFNSSSTAEEVTEGINLRGMTIAITGVNSGLGYETMRILSLRGAHIIGIACTQAKADKACAAIDGRATPMF
ncbi:MAG: hypothetical protein P8L39_02705 [Halioglobus sp.]|nr:hypothetical protein [Halioglobus sp.]